MAKSQVVFVNHAYEALSDIEKALHRGLEKCGLVAEGYAKLNCPVDTGRLRNSISHAYDANNYTAYIGTNVSYAPYVELGTRFRKPKHFLRKAAAEHIDEYKDILNNS